MNANVTYPRIWLLCASCLDADMGTVISSVEVTNSNQKMIQVLEDLIKAFGCVPAYTLDESAKGRNLNEVPFRWSCEDIANSCKLPIQPSQHCAPCPKCLGEGINWLCSAKCGRKHWNGVNFTCPEWCVELQQKACDCSVKEDAK